jgi:hypothetical protein
MADVYASAIGTTVFRLKDIPPRPQEYDGKFCLFGLKDDEAAVRRALGVFGQITSCELQKNPAVVQFDTHEAARAARRVVEKATAMCSTAEASRAALVEALGLNCEGADTMYNER